MSLALAIFFTVRFVEYFNPDWKVSEDGRRNT
jgi:hypothetical protein